ncbi:hypothetical protein ACI2OX_22150 [Bacillus sp. N9]
MPLLALLLQGCCCRYKVAAGLLQGWATRLALHRLLGCCCYRLLLGCYKALGCCC